MAVAGAGGADYELLKRKRVSSDGGFGSSGVGSGGGGGGGGASREDVIAGEIREFHKRQRDMLGRVLALEVRNEQLLRDSAGLAGEMTRLWEMQAAVHVVLQAAAAEGSQAAYALVKAKGMQ